MIDEIDVAEYLSDSRIYERAVDYFDAGRVDHLALSGSGVTAEVRGSGGRHYTVTIEIAGNEVISSCTCPYPDRCKHIGAVLLEIQESELLPEGDVDAFYEPVPTLPEGVLDLASDGNAVRFRSLIAPERGEFPITLFDSNGTISPAGQHVLVIALVAESFGHFGIEVDLYVTPMLRYIRKDGNPGAFKKWRPKIECLAESVQEIELLSVLNRRDRRYLPFDRIIPGQLLHPNPVPLWIELPSDRYGEASTLTPASIHRARTVELHFHPTAYGHGHVAFTTELSIITYSGEKLAFGPLHPVRRTEETTARYTVTESVPDLTNAPKLWYGRSSAGTVIVNSTNGTVALIDDLQVSGLLHRIGYGSRRTFLFPEIRELARSTDLDGLQVYVPPRRVQFNMSEVLPVLEIGRDRRIRISTRYGVPPPPAPGPPAPAPEDDLLILDVASTARGNDVLEWAYDMSVTLLDRWGAYIGRDGRIVCTASVAEIVDALAPAILEAGGDIRIDEKPLRRGSFTPSLRVVSAGEDWFDIGLFLQANGEEENFDPKNPLIYTSSGEVLLLRNVAELQKLLRRLNLRKDGTARITSGDISAIDELSDRLELGSSEPETRAAEILRKTERRRDAWLELAGKLDALDRDDPPGFGTTLRPYQKVGFAWLSESLDVGLAPLLADDMGLGKTVQTLAVLQERALRGEITSVLVVAPPATLENWRHETISFAPAVTPALYHGTGRSLPDDMPRVVITSYQTLRVDIAVLGAVSWDIVVFDEIQTIKNAKTKTYRSAGAVSATHRIALSGTPVENTSLELHAIVDILNPGILGNRTSFIRRFGTPIERDDDPETRQRLRTFLRPLILRRRKSEVARDLPERDEIPLYVALPPAQRSVYNRIRDEYRERLRQVLASESPQKRIFLILEGLTRLRQAAIDHRLVTSRMGKAPALGSLTASAKIAALDDLVPRVIEDGHRVLIFSQFVQFLSMLTAWADERRLSYCYLDGSMSPKQRQSEIERFQAESGPPLFFISLRAGGTGINLTAADYVILTDPWWNPAVEEQAIDRTHRIGQTRPVTAYRIIAADTVEEKIAALQERKRRLAEDIVPDERTTLTALSTETLLDLFS